MKFNTKKVRRNNRIFKAVCEGSTYRYQADLYEVSHNRISILFWREIGTIRLHMLHNNIDFPTRTLKQCREHKENLFEIKSTIDSK